MSLRISDINIGPCFLIRNLVHLRVDEGDVYLGCVQIYIVLHNNTKRAGAHHTGVLPVLFWYVKGWKHAQWVLL